LDENSWLSTSHKTRECSWQRGNTSISTLLCRHLLLAYLFDNNAALPESAREERPLEKETMYRRLLSLIGCSCFLVLALMGCGNTTAAGPAVSPTTTATATATPAPTATATSSGLPDLLPVAGPSGSFCRFDNQGNVAVTIKNQGTGAAGPSTTSVKFVGQFTSPLGSGTTGGTYTAMTPAIPAGQSVDVSVSILLTGGQIVSGSLTITANATHQVTESDETNNAIQVQC
jgi:hypothetical protein